MNAVVREQVRRNRKTPEHNNRCHQFCDACKFQLRRRFEEAGNFIGDYMVNGFQDLLLMLILIEGIA